MYKLSEKYPQKRAFITGAASGLGKTLCLELARDGWTIGICDLNPQQLELTAAEIEQAGGKALSFTLDVSDKGRYKEAVESFLDQTGGIDLLVNNAGVGDGGAFEDYSLENWQWLLSINQMGPLYGCHYFVPVMKRQGYGQIINISSAAAFMNPGYMSAYNMSKAAVLSLSETLFAELRQHNIKIAVVMPTFFNSGIMQHCRSTDSTLEVVNYLMGLSNLPVEILANNILKLSARGRFYIIMPLQARIFFHLKRFFPFSTLKMNSLIFKNIKPIKASLQKQYIRKTGKDIGAVPAKENISIK
jgi:NAD(P)-dependent dehydrogenase (short-subunit alcohol dehydrogenase family)